MKYKIYIDFDGVILDTWEYIFSQYKKKYNTDIIYEKSIKELMIEVGWNTIINKSNIINNSIDEIITLSKKYDVCILTKVNSKEEKKCKIEYLNKYGIKNIICVPYEERKSDYAITNNSYLIDDDIRNLIDWEEKNGIPIYFNKNLDNKDSYGENNIKYKTIDNINKIYDIINLN